MNHCFILIHLAAQPMHQHKGGGIDAVAASPSRRVASAAMPLLDSRHGPIRLLA